MSTISTQLNWGSSYIVNDFYRQNLRKNASEKELVNIGRLATVLLMVTSAILALLLTNAKQLFDIILMFGAGTGLVYILRWFWWRINAWSEISVMFTAAIISMVFTLSPLGSFLFGSTATDGTLTAGVFPSWATLPITVIITTLVWLIVTFITKPEDKEVLYSFYQTTQPGGPGWKKITDQARAEDVNIVDGRQ